ncbi:MAG: hypothetical protein OEZ22_07525 [Spirochaetia bacterium]|nr:hypothetical protein [Spirochaetia bacterium]
MKRLYFKCVILLFISGLNSPSFSIIPHIDVVDTHTAITLPRATYNISFWGYENGGILNKTVLGLNEFIYVGASFNVEGAIGTGDAKFNIPGVIAKIKFTDGWADYPLLIAAGYDSFYTGRNSNGTYDNNNKIVYGPHISITKPVFAMEQEQHIHAGIRTPIQPASVPKDTELYIGIDFPIGYFVPMIEIERIYFDAKRTKEILFNFGLRFNIFEGLAVEFDLMTGMKRKSSRMLVFEFMGYF